MTIKPELARRLAAVVAAGGPNVTPTEALSVVADLRLGMERARSLVGELTGMYEAAEAAHGVNVCVVDRPRWAHGAAQSIAAMIARADVPGQKRANAVVALGVSALARMVLGQYDPFGAQGRDRSSQHGRVLLNAPVIAQFCEKHNVDQRDFCMWVCVHEFTHAVQYHAAPWIADYIVERCAAIIGDAAEEDLLDSQLAQELMAVMSVLEGHAEYTMNTVPVATMPGKHHIMAAMRAQRLNRGFLSRIFMKSFALDQKAAQYARGSEFVKAVIEAENQEFFNRVWESPSSMPTMDELVSPQLWISRMSVRAE